MLDQPSHDCPIDCPNRKSPKRQERAGMVVGAFAIAAFVWMWAVRAAVERKSPTSFEIILASCSAAALLVDPKSVAQAGVGAIGKVTGGMSERSDDTNV